jgi:hypothetical protein
MVLYDNLLANYHQNICESDGSFRQPPFSIIINTSVKQIVFLENPLANSHQNICERHGVFRQPPGQFSLKHL